MRLSNRAVWGKVGDLTHASEACDVKEGIDRWRGSERGLTNAVLLPLPPRTEPDDPTRDLQADRSYMKEVSPR